MKDAAQAVDATLAAVGSKATYTGASAATASWFLSSEFGFIVGICLGVLGFLMNFYFSRRRDRREQDEYELRMQRKDKP